MKNFKLIILSLTVLFSVNHAFAQEEGEEKKNSPLKISGFADVYYQYNFNDNNPGLTSFTERHNSFELGMANIVLSKEVGKVGFVADIGFGSRANTANGVEGSTVDPIKQLYITYSPVDKVTITAGNFGTHVGYEVIDANANFNYSTSFLFSYGPFYHTGVKVDFALSDEIGLMVGVFNDTDAKSDVLAGKHIGAQVSYAKDDLSLYLNYLGGASGLVDVDRHQIDLTGTYQAADNFLVGLNVSNSSFVPENGDNTTLFGAALYLNYDVSDSFGLGLRGEYFDDGDAVVFGVPDLGITQLTLSANLKEGPLTFIPELRLDSDSEDIFVDADGNATGSSFAAILAVVYSFE